MPVSPERHLHLKKLFGSSIDEWVKKGHTQPHPAERWFRLLPGHFLKECSQGEHKTPSTKLNYGSKAKTMLENGLPVQVEVLPAFAPEYLWLSAEVSMHQDGLPRAEPRAFYPTPLHVDDLAPTLELWQLDGLRWTHFGSSPVFDPGWKIERYCVDPRPFTYFAVSKDHRYLTAGSAYAVPVGAKKAVWVGPRKTLLGLERIGGCRVKLERVEEKLHAAGLEGILSEEACLRRENGKLYRANARALRRVARFCGRHFHKYIVEGKRDLMGHFRELKP